MELSKYDTIVIGGGVSGLACALLRARKGEHVAVVEKSSRLSPTLCGFARGGTHMDLGLHYASSMGPGGLLSSLLDELGVLEALEAEICVLDVFDRVRFLEPAFEFSFLQGWDALQESLCDAFPADCSGLKSFLAEVRALWERCRTAFLCDRGRSLGAFFTSEGRTLQEAIDRYTSNPVLGGLLSSHGILYGTHSRETSLTFHSQIIGSYYESACVIRGGGKAWVKAFEGELRDAGAELICGRGVAGIELDDQGRFAAVELETGERLAANRCISTIHPKLLLEMVPSNGFSAAYKRRIREFEETLSAVVLFGRCPSANFSGNLILAGAPHRDKSWQQLRLEERPLFVTSSMGASNHGVSVICPAHLADVPRWGVRADGGRPDGYQDWKMEVADRLVRRLSTHAGDLLGRLELLDIATPLTFRDWLSSPEGALYGIKHRLVDLPLLPRTRVEGLYLSGQAVVAPGVLGALCASFLTDSLVV